VPPYVDKILKGADPADPADPADLPLEPRTLFEFVIF